MNGTVERVVVYADRDGMDPEGTIADRDWPEAWDRYAEMMRTALAKLWPEAEVEVRQQVSTESVHFLLSDDALGDDTGPHAAFDDLADTVFTSWCQWCAVVLARDRLDRCRAGL